MRKVVSILFGLTATFFFFKSMLLSLLYLYKTGGILLCLFGLFTWPFTMMIAPFYAGLQQGDWAPMINGLLVLPCMILAGITSAGK
jgi:hypothetical protein